MSLQSCLSHMKLFGMLGSKRVGFFESRILGAFLGVDVGMIKVTIEVGFACVGGGCVCCVDLGSGGISTLCSFSLLVFLL